MNLSHQHDSEATVHDASQSNSRTALVLGGGGSAGNAWLIGVIAGLFDAGLDVTTADLIIGTSAGATAAAQITGARPTELFASILAAAPTPAPQRIAGGPVPNGQREGLERVTRVIAASENAADMRRRMGAAAIELDAASNGSSSDGSARWRAIVAARLPGLTWPQQRVLMTAVDAETGEDATMSRDSGVDLIDAVAASTSGGPAYSIGDRKYIDGGYRRNENADLAAGYERVLVLSPLGGRTLHPLEWRMQLSAQVEDLVASGSRVETILPNSNSLEAFGDNMMDLSTRPAAARAGYEQGRALADHLAQFWRG
ncbi:MAG: patatin-like phospholipase family protein [Cryobacterium sp.]|nr:patatin-like phospholipase family protein [Cryobacterium sp.]